MPATATGRFPLALMLLLPPVTGSAPRHATIENAREFAGKI